VRSALALLRWLARYGALTVVSKATASHVLYVVLVIDALRWVLIPTPP